MANIDTKDYVGLTAIRRFFNNFKSVFDNVIGNKDISTIGDGTVTGAIDAVSSDLSAHKNDSNIHITSKDRSSWDAKIDSNQKGVANGVATLDGTGKVPSAQLPSYVDDVLEYSSKSDFPKTGESGKIYVALDTNLTYRWGGTEYVEISPSLALGETSTTAYAGDKGKALADKLATIASGAEVNVQSDWEVQDTSSDAFIKNKPFIPTISNDYSPFSEDGMSGYAVAEAIDEVSDIYNEVGVDLMLQTKKGEVRLNSLSSLSEIDSDGNPIPTFDFAWVNLENFSWVYNGEYNAHVSNFNYSVELLNSVNYKTASKEFFLNGIDDNLISIFDGFIWVRDGSLQISGIPKGLISFKADKGANDELDLRSSIVVKESSKNLWNSSIVEESIFNDSNFGLTFENQGNYVFSSSSVPSDISSEKKYILSLDANTPYLYNPDETNPDYYSWKIKFSKPMNFVCIYEDGTSYVYARKYIFYNMTDESIEYEYMYSGQRVESSFSPNYTLSDGRKIAVLTFYSWVRDTDDFYHVNRLYQNQPNGLGLLLSEFILGAPYNYITDERIINASEDSSMEYLLKYRKYLKSTKAFIGSEEQVGEEFNFNLADGEGAYFYTQTLKDFLRIEDPMLEYDVKSEYEPYIEKNIIIPTNREMYGIGSNYDSIEKVDDEWNFVYRIAKTILDKNFFVATSVSNVFSSSRYAQEIKTPSSDSLKADVLCSNFTVDTATNVKAGTTNNTIAVDTNGIVYICSNNESLISNNFYYALRMPNYEKLSSNYYAKQIKGQFDLYGLVSYDDFTEITTPEKNVVIDVDYAKNGIGALLIENSNLISLKQNKDVAVTHNYGKATGSYQKPVFIDQDGVATEISYTISSSVPSNAKFTDTTYDVVTEETDGLMSSSDKQKLDGISAVTETTVSDWGFTKNIGTITGIKMNGDSKGNSGEVDLGTVITSHQSLDNCVKKRDNGYSYNNLASFYQGSNIEKYVRITIPSYEVWTMCSLEISLKSNYGSGAFGKILFYGNWSNTAEWNTLNASVYGSLPETIKMYCSDKRYVYIEGCYSYSTCTVDKMTIGDSAINFDLSGVTIDSVSSLPEVYQNVSMRYDVNSSNIGSQTVSKATKVVDYNNANNDISIGWDGDCLEDFRYFAGYTSVNGKPRIKDLSLEGVKNKLNLTQTGSSIVPVYLDSSGKPTAISCSIQSSVPSDAVFTDNKVKQTSVTPSSYTNWRPLLIGASNSSTEGFTPTTVTDEAITSSTITVQPSTGTIKANRFLGMQEAYLGWGGKNIQYGYSPVDASLVPSLGANRLAFMDTSGITVEYSRDGGTTWIAYETVGTDSDKERKTNLFNGIGSSYGIGKHDSSTKATTNGSNFQLRVTLRTDLAQVYTMLNKFAIYISTNGSYNCTCTVTGRTKADLDAGNNTWVTFASEAPIAGWSGWNVINTSGITTYGNTSSQYVNVRFLFKANGGSSSYNGLVIYQILGYGGMGWTEPSNLASKGTIYSYDWKQNVYFPANVVGNNIKSKGSSTKPIYLDSSGVGQECVFDTTPTKDSNNLITSGAVYSLFNSIVDANNKSY